MDVSGLNELRSVEELANAQKGVKDEIKSLNEEFNGLPFPDDARERYAGLVEVNEEIDKRVVELDKRAKYLDAMAGDPGRTVPVQDLPRRDERVSMKERDIYDTSSVRIDPENPEKGKQEYRDRAMRALEVARFPEIVSQDDAQHKVAKMLDEIDTDDGWLARRILKTGSPAYRSAFRKWMKAAAGIPVSYTPEERAFTLGSTGMPVTFLLDPTIIPVSSSVVNPLRAIANVESIVGGNEWRGVTAAAITANRRSEAATVTDNTPVLAQPAVVCSRVDAFVQFSVEVEGDWPGMDTGMARLFADAKDDEEATSFYSGNGTPPNPFGVSTGTTGTTAESTGLTVTAANLYAGEAALAPRFRPRAQWIGNRAIFNIVRALDTAGGAQLWLRIGEQIGNSPASAGGNGNTGLRLLGYPVNELSTMPSTVTNGVINLIIGDFSLFKIIDRIGMNVELVPQIMTGTPALPTGQRGLFAWWRNGSKVLSATAFRGLTGTT